MWGSELVAIACWAGEPGDLSASCLSDTRASHVAPGQWLSKPTIHCPPTSVSVCERQDEFVENYSCTVLLVCLIFTHNGVKYTEHPAIVEKCFDVRCMRAYEPGEEQ